MHVAANDLQTPYPASRLVHRDNSPLRVADLAPGESFIFSYPYVTTPCFLMRLDMQGQGQDGQNFLPGGLGDDLSILAFSAICSHKLSHPAKPISHINFRSEPVSFVDSDGIAQQRDQLISCCSERSVYDPAAGGKVLAGPAPSPLAAIVLQTNEQDEIIATGSHGADQYDRFLQKFGFRLALEYGVTDVRARSGADTQATPASEFSKQQIRC